jgi:hypothetical protein
VHTIVEVEKAISNVQDRFGLFYSDMLYLWFCLGENMAATENSEDQRNK